MNERIWDNGTVSTTSPSIQGWVTLNDPNNYQLTIATDNSQGIGPSLYFKYIKSKFTLIQRSKIDKRIKELEAAFEVAVENGQDVLAEKFLANMNTMAKEALLYAKGIVKCIDRKDLTKYKNSIRGGHISNTLLKDFTRVIPRGVMKRLATVKELFDTIEIWHYWDESAKDVKRMTREEKEKMKDPVMFGMFKGSDKMYFIAEWEDEYCNLTFKEMTRVIMKQKSKEEK